MKEMSPTWVVRFKTKSGSIHPIWYGNEWDAPIPRSRVERSAKRYLANRKDDWLTGEMEIEPQNQR